MTRFLLDHQSLRWFIAVAVGILVGLFFASEFTIVHLTFTTTLPGALISLMGFVIAAAAIVVAMKDQGLLRTFSDHSPAAWNDLMTQFFRAAKYSAGYAFFLLLLSAMPLPGPQELLTRAAYSTSSAWFTLVVVQLLMTIRALESASRLSSAERKNPDPPTPYKLPEDRPQHIYQEPQEP